MRAMELVEGIRREMRARGIHYGELGRAIGVSDSTIKRMLGVSADISLRRLEQICEFLELDISALLETPDRPLAFDQLTSEQEHFLASDIELLRLFYLSMFHSTVDSIVAASGILRSKVVKGLFALQKQGLVELNPRDRVRANRGYLFRWADNGPLSKLSWEKIRNEFLDIEHYKGDFKLYFFKVFLLSPASQRLLRSRFEEIICEAMELAKLDMKFNRKDLSPWGVFLAMRDYIPSFMKHAKEERAWN